MDHPDGFCDKAAVQVDAYFYGGYPRNYLSKADGGKVVPFGNWGGTLFAAADLDGDRVVSDHLLQIRPTRLGFL